MECGHRGMHRTVTHCTTHCTHRWQIRHTRARRRRATHCTTHCTSRLHLFKAAVDALNRMPDDNQDVQREYVQREYIGK